MLRQSLLFVLTFSTIALGQATTDASSTVAPAVAPTSDTAYAFEVATMHLNRSPRGGGIGTYRSTPDGYSVNNMSLRNIILTAFAPKIGTAAFYTSDQVKGMPSWADSEHYNIEARVSEKDRAAWQNSQSRNKMLQAMLQNLLATRCGLVTHQEVKVIKVLSLELAKGGPKFKESPPEEKFPAGIKLPWGGVVLPTATGMRMYGTTMASFATVLTERADSGYPIQDKTGLKGKYDITLEADAPTAPPVSEGTGLAPHSSGSEEDELDAAMLSAVTKLGLRLTSTKSEVETLVIDHLDHASAN